MLRWSGSRTRRWAVLWLAGYLLFLALVLWLSTANPASVQGAPADPWARRGILSVVVLPLALWLGTVLGRLDEDAVAARVSIVVTVALACAVVAAMVGLLPDDLRSCLALRRLPELPARCSTTPQLRRSVLLEVTLVQLAFGASWLASDRRSRRRGSQRRTSTGLH